MGMGYDDSNNVFSKMLGIWVFLTIYCTLCTKLIFWGGRFLYKIRHAGPVCAAAATVARIWPEFRVLKGVDC
jgi:hypothetical protein